MYSPTVTCYCYCYVSCPALTEMERGSIVPRRYKCIKKSQARKGFEMNSDKSSILPAQTNIEVYEIRKNEQGGEFTRNLTLLVICRSFLTDCLWLQCSACATPMDGSLRSPAAA